MKKQIKRGYIKVYHDKVFPGDNVLIMFGKGSVITGKLISMNLVKDLLPDMDVIEYVLSDKNSDSYVHIAVNDLCCVLKDKG